MTKATRWGVTALMVIGGLSLGAFAGCSDDDTPQQQTEEDTGTPDTAKPDTQTPMDTQVTDTADAPEFVADRAATLVFGSPDLGSKFVCFGAFLEDPAAAAAPLQTLPPTGAVGVPDPTAADDFTKTTALPYGAVVPIPMSELAVAALNTFNFVVYLVDANPAASSKTCKEVWADIKADTWRWKSFPKETIKAGDHGIISFEGCKTPGAPCGAGAFNIKLHKASFTAKPTESGANLGVQFLHLSQFDGFDVALEAGTVRVPGFQSSDIYLVPGVAPSTSDAGADAADADETGDAEVDAAAPAPTFIKIAENVKYGDELTALKGITLPAGTKNDLSRLVIATRIPTDGGSVSYPCANPIEAGKAGSAPSGTCPNWTFYLKPFFDGGKYPALGGGLEYPNTNQLFIIAGNPVPADSTATLRIMSARATKWAP
jgi:hypothetical protein